MKTPIENLTDRIRLTSSISLAVFLLVGGCAAPKPMTTPNPLEGWHFSSLNNLDSNKAIMDDYQDYIERLPPEEKKYVGTIHFLDDGMGQHAINIEIGINGTWWEHVLIYDKNNKRVKTVKYSNGHYMS